MYYEENENPYRLKTSTETDDQMSMFALLMGDDDKSVEVSGSEDEGYDDEDEEEFEDEDETESEPEPPTGTGKVVSFRTQPQTYASLNDLASTSTPTAQGQGTKVSNSNNTTNQHQNQHVQQTQAQQKGSNVNKEKQPMQPQQPLRQTQAQAQHGNAGAGATGYQQPQYPYPNQNPARNWNQNPQQYVYGYANGAEEELEGDYPPMPMPAQRQRVQQPQTQRQTRPAPARQQYNNPAQGQGQPANNSRYSQYQDEEGYYEEDEEGYYDEEEPAQEKKAGPFDFIIRFLNGPSKRELAARGYEPNPKKIKRRWQRFAITNGPGGRGAALVGVFFGALFWAIGGFCFVEAMGKLGLFSFNPRGMEWLFGWLNSILPFGCWLFYIMLTYYQWWYMPTSKRDLQVMPPFALGLWVFVMFIDISFSVGGAYSYWSSITQVPGFWFGTLGFGPNGLLTYFLSVLVGFVAAFFAEPLVRYYWGEFRGPGEEDDGYYEDEDYESDEEEYEAVAPAPVSNRPGSKRNNNRVAASVAPARRTNAGGRGANAAATKTQVPQRPGQTAARSQLRRN